MPRAAPSILLLLLGAPAAQSWSAESAASAKALLAKMNRTEKIAMVHGYGPKVVPGGVGYVVPNDRLGIPPLILANGPQGWGPWTGEAGNSTCWPSGLTVGATWDPALAERWGAAMGEEFFEKGTNVQLGPGLCVNRVPTCGRAFEYISGEDPFLGAVMGGPVVRGIQSKGILSNAKHWVLNSQETDRQGDDAIVDERTRFEMYYPPYEGAIAAGVASFMCSFNRVNGEWSCGNKHTLAVDLKQRLGFAGFVMSDWGATHSTAIGAGLDMEMPGGRGCPPQTVCPTGTPFMGPAEPDGSCPPHTSGCINASVSESTLDDSLFRILAPMYEFGLFKNAAQWSDLSKRSLTVTSAAHSRLAREIAAAATVLLRNERQALPLAEGGKKIAVIGAQAATPSVHGGGSGQVTPTYVISPLQGICNRTAASSDCVYDAGSDPEQAAAVAAAADVVIVVVGDSSSEGRDRPNLSFSGGQDALVTTVAAATKPSARSIVVGLNPGPVLLPWAEQVDAVLLMFSPGLECGHALADILWGDVNPSARLPVTIPTKENEVGLTKAQYPGVTTGDHLTSHYTERLEIGYRWYDARGAEPHFAFGHGLSFSAFSYSKLRLPTLSGGAMKGNASCVVTNTAGPAGAEVAQLYIGFPQAAGEPPQQLKGFAKTKVLQPGESTVVQFPLTARSFSIWDVSTHSWAVPKGTFGLTVGASSRDPRLTGQISLGGEDHGGARKVSSRLLSDDGRVLKADDEAAPALSAYSIRLSATATAEERYAGTTLQRWLQAACGCKIPLLTMATNASGSPCIAVGSDAARSLLSPAVVDEESSGLGEEGFLLIGHAATFSVAITGGPQARRGTIYGVYEFLEMLGFGFWSSNATTVPRLKHCWIEGLHERQTPALSDWRHNNNANLELEAHAEFSIAARQNNNGGVEVYTSQDVRKVGGGVRWASPPGFVHTSFTIVPPELHRESNPEWFGQNQLCWTNKSLVKFVIQRVRGYLEADPDATVISVSQNDGGGAGICHSPEEDAVAKAEGSAAGPLLRAVNAVADAIADDHPKVVVETLAYTYTRKPPQITRPRPNVVIRLSNIECDFFAPLSSSSVPANRAFVSDLKAWSAISNRTWVWTYAADFAHWIQPWPDMYSLAPNIKLYLEHGVTGVYQEAQYMSYGGDLQALKSWLGTKLMWQPERSTAELIATFLRGYYGERAAPFVQRHIDIFVNSSKQASGAESMGYNSEYLSPEACLAALSNLDRAKQAASKTPEVVARLEAVELGTMYVVLLRWDEMTAWSKANDIDWPVAGTKQDALAAFTQVYRREGMDVRVGFPSPADSPIACNGAKTCYVLNGTLHPSTCGLACATVPCDAETGKCDVDCGLSESCHGLKWFTQMVMHGPPPPPPPPPPPSGPPGRRSFPDCWGYDCGPGSKDARPATAFGDRCFPANGGSSGLGPFVCCNASVPAKWQAKQPCTLSASVFGCWWPVSAGCPGVPANSVCPVSQPYEYGDDAAGLFCCSSDSGPRTGMCTESCCLKPGTGSKCQGRPLCYNETTRQPALRRVLKADDDEGATPGAAAGGNYDARIASAHARSEQSLAAQLRTFATQEVIPITSCARWSIQNGAVSVAMAHMFSNDNQQQVAIANAFWYNLSHCLAPGPSMGPVGQPLEMSYVSRAFALFNSRSPAAHQRAHSVAVFDAKTEAAMQRMFFRYLAQFGPLEHRFPSIHHQFGSENRDTVEQTSCYLAAQYLSLDPAYSNRTLYANNTRTVTEAATLLDDFMYSWLRDRATHGFFIELASNSYWYRTWPAVYNLRDLPLSARVRQRAKMMIELAVVEAEQASIGGQRGGVKCRSKKDDLGHHNGLNHSMISSLGPDLFGENGSSALFINLATQRNGGSAAGNVSILMHELGNAPESDGVYISRTRMIGQIGSTEANTPLHDTAQARNDEGYVVTYRNVSDAVHTISATKSYVLGGVEFDPRNRFSPNEQDRWTGLIFSNKVTPPAAGPTVLGLPHGTGDKWCVVGSNVMIAQGCPGCGYSGSPVLSIEGATVAHLNMTSSGWIIIEAGSIGFAAARPAWGGWVEPARVPFRKPRGCHHVGNGCGCGVPGHFTKPDANNTCPATWNFVKGADLAWADHASPIVMVAVEKGSAVGQFESLEAFAAAVEAAPLSSGNGSLTFSWGAEQRYEFFPASNTTAPTGYRLPTINGKQVDVAPPYGYASPHLQAPVYGSPIVTARYGAGYVLEYDFGADTITRVKTDDDHIL